MNAPQCPSAASAPPLAGLGFALLAPEIDGPGADQHEVAGSEAQWLREWRRRCVGADGEPAQMWQRWRQSPPPEDLRLHALAAHLGLGAAETLATALACAVELQPMAGRALAWLQSPAGGARPTLGLVATGAAALDCTGPEFYLGALVGGPARECGLLQSEGDARSLPETALRVPIPLALALAGLPSSWPSVQIGCNDAPALPPSTLQQANRHAAALAVTRHALAIRCGHPREARAVAQTIATALQAEAAFITGDAPAGLGPWLWLSGRLPVFCAELGPGEQRELGALPGYGGPVLIAAGPDGSFEHEGEPAANWRVAPPHADERAALWLTATGASELAAHVGTAFRHSAARIQGLTRAGRFQAALDGRDEVTAQDIALAGRVGAAADLGTLAQLLPDTIGDDALVLPAPLRMELESLLRRCLGRDTLADGLGPAVRARHKPGVRALLYGASGTGKTLAVGWLATRLGLPLYRVDLASVTSKYIGETEKNLAQLFARAEHAEVVLMFDEADALFGKRTDVKDANDRFANAQTNYLLQRIESFEGIALLTSNTRARFDSAFTRRLDAIIEFPLPAPEERRALWLAHLGSAHALAVSEINALAAACDLAGGHIRNVVLAAAASARQAGGVIGYADVVAGVAGEYRKLGKQPPGNLLPVAPRTQ